MEKIKHCLIIGASSELAGSTIKTYLNHPTDSYQIQAVSQKNKAMESDRLQWHQCEYEELAIASTCHEILSGNPPLDEIIIFNGQLHWENQSPEKQIKDIDPEYFNRIFSSNTLVPMLFLKHLVPKLSTTHPCKIIILSARVGSIQDNRLGGWYSYRASKTALNMMIKSLAIETARKTNQIKFILYHPGTTNTPLSKPFQKNVPEAQLFTTQQSAQYLIKVLSKQEYDGSVSYLDWRGDEIDW